MAPRKTNNTTPNPKVPRKRGQVKKPLKTPTIIKLKIPTQKPDPDSSTPKLTEKQLLVQRKIELANEVALAQLNKKAEIIDNVTTTEPEKKKTKCRKNNKTTPASKPRARQKVQKTVSSFFNGTAETQSLTAETAEADSAVTTKPSPKKINKKNPVPKKRKTKNSCPQIKSADSTVCKKGRPPKNQKEPTAVVSRNLRSKNQAEVEEIAPAAAVTRTDSRASSTLSWTRDISSSSAVTCVTVQDLVLIDQRLPVLQLPDIVASGVVDAPATVPTPSSDSDSSSSSTSSSSSNLSAATLGLESTPLDLKAPDHLNLSISSSEHIDKPSAPVALSECDALLLEIIAAKKKVERVVDAFMELLNEPGSSNSDDGNGLVRSFTDLGDIERECTSIRQFLKGEIVDEEDDKKMEEPVSPACARPDSEEGKYVNDDVLDYDNYTHFEHSPDDDDAISLFAESTFTDAEGGTSRRDEYVPRPVALTRPPHAHVYHPTPIATSTPAPPDPLPPPPAPPPLVNSTSAPAPAGKPHLLADLYQQIHGTKSAVFHGVCFYNIAVGGCRNVVCRFPHADLPVEEVERRLAALGEVEFIQEYMLVRIWPSLRRRYGPRFLREAERRDLTRVVLEMAIDCTSKARAGSPEDAAQRQEALEAALTRLSCEPAAVRACADLLRLKVPYASGQRSLLGLLLHALANTANFSRFKRGFIELAALVVADGSRERLDPGPIVKILERVCILPYEERLVRAMLGVVRLTDAAAVAPLMPQFISLVAALPDHSSEDPPTPPPPTPLTNNTPPQITQPVITRTVDFRRVCHTPRGFRGQWMHQRGRGRGSHLAGYRHPMPPPMFMRRPHQKFFNGNKN